MKRGEFKIHGRITATYLRQEAFGQPGGHALFPWVLVVVVTPDDGSTAQELIIHEGGLRDSLRRPDEPTHERDGHRVIVHGRYEKLHPFTRARVRSATFMEDLDTGEHWAEHGAIQDARPRS